MGITFFTLLLTSLTNSTSDVQASITTDQLPTSNQIAKKSDRFQSETAILRTVSVSRLSSFEVVKETIEQVFKTMWDVICWPVIKIQDYFQDRDLAKSEDSDLQDKYCEKTNDYLDELLNVKDSKITVSEYTKKTATIKIEFTKTSLKDTPALKNNPNLSHGTLNLKLKLDKPIMNEDNDSGTEVTIENLINQKLGLEKGSQEFEDTKLIDSLFDKRAEQASQIKIASTNLDQDSLKTDEKPYYQGAANIIAAQNKFKSMSDSQLIDWLNENSDGLSFTVMYITKTQLTDDQSQSLMLNVTKIENFPKKASVIVYNPDGGMYWMKVQDGSLVPYDLMNNNR